MTTQVNKSPSANWYIAFTRAGHKQFFWVETGDIAASTAKELGYDLARGIQGPFQTRKECEALGAN